MNDPGEQIRFPVTCQYKVVASAESENIQADLAWVIRRFSLESRPEKGNQSRNGTYQTWAFTCTIHDLETLRAVSAALSAIEGVKVVL